MPARLVVHGHFYQPPRENPWTEEVPVEPSAAPAHDWNERITAECYRPNGWARVLDPRGRVRDIVDNYTYLSFNFGPTLLSWLEVHHPEVYARILASDKAGGGAIAQAYNHAILPLAEPRDRRTQIAWGLADFAHRFGRPATGMWLPETAVNDDVLTDLVDAGVGFTILAPAQAQAVRPRVDDGHPGDWAPVTVATLDTARPYWWAHPAGDGRGLAIVFYDGPFSHDLAFNLAGLTSEELVARAVAMTNGDDALVCVATDGETFGHHHKFADRTLAFAFSQASQDAGLRVTNATLAVDEIEPTHEVQVRESAWSCAHGVARWREDCGCRTGGEPGWNQRWRAPLREALDVLRHAAAEVFEHRGAAVLRDPWAARDAYVAVILGSVSRDDFAAAHLVDGHDHDMAVEAFTLLEAQRNALLMFTSCGWFFNDLAGIETLQVLRYAARVIDLLGELGEHPPTDAFLDVLGRAESNRPDEGNGRDVWRRHVEPAKVDAGRVVAHMALVELLEQGVADDRLAAHVIERHDRRRREWGGIAGCAGRVELRHARTGRPSTHVYAALHLGGLEVYGATRPVDGGDDDDSLFAGLADAVARGERVPALLRLITEGFGPREFGLDSALPDAAAQIVQSTAAALTERFALGYEHLYDDHRSTITALVSAGYPLPSVLRAPVELALARRLDAEVADAVTSADVDAFRHARDIVREARTLGLRLATPQAAATMGRMVLAAVERAVEAPEPERIAAALALLRLIADLGLGVDLDRAQERVFEAIHLDAAVRDRLAELAVSLRLAVDDPR